MGLFKRDAPDNLFATPIVAPLPKHLKPADTNLDNAARLQHQYQIGVRQELKLVGAQDDALAFQKPRQALVKHVS